VKEIEAAAAAVCVKVRSQVFFFSKQRVGFFLGCWGKMVYELKKWKPFSEKM
jgi:hypothetical protein